MSRPSHLAYRVVSFLLGGSIVALCSSFACGAFGVLTMMMSPALAGADYWSAVRERAEATHYLQAR